jgi:cyclase
VSNDNTKIVPGHGALAKKADLVAWHEMLVTSRSRPEIVRRRSERAGVLAEKPLADLDKKWAANDQQAQNWLVAVHVDLSHPLGFVRAFRQSD